MRVNYDEGAVVDFESNRCISCGSYGDVNYCVRCRARDLGASEKATLRFVYTNDDGEITRVEEIWLH